jgi:hypothetical protein
MNNTAFTFYSNLGFVTLSSNSPNIMIYTYKGGNKYKKNKNKTKKNKTKKNKTKKNKTKKNKINLKMVHIKYIKF